MEQVTINKCKFAELSDKAKEKARQWMRECIDVDEWSDPVTDDAQQVGVKITGFDIGRGEVCDIEFENSAGATAIGIMKEHGVGCDTYEAAAVYVETLSALKRNEDGEVDPDEADRALDNFQRQLSACYLKSLREQHEYVYSDEAIDETIEANEYDFDEHGNRWRY
jgi:hypothetical protein